MADCLSGVNAISQGVCLLEGYHVLLREDLELLRGKVAVVTGGGSGHEPCHPGYVGKGMLTAAVAGKVFTSPPVSSIMACLRVLWKRAQPAGVLMVVTNYTGDRVNFGLAAERARAEMGLSCDMVLVGEDCALTSKDRTAGRRGLAGTILVHKVAGAMAEEGLALEEIVRFIRGNILDEMGTIGLCLAPCSLPGAKASFNLEEDEMELGLGIHGEAGVRRIKLTASLEAMNTMVEHMTNSESSTHLDVKSGNDVVILLNNLGGTSNLEMGIVANDLVKIAQEKGWKIRRFYSGTFMTALEMTGVSVTVLKLGGHNGEAILKYLDLPVVPKAWPNVCHEHNATPNTIPDEATVDTAEGDIKRPLSDFGRMVAGRAIEFACEALKSCESQLNNLDSTSGDGDCGSTFKRGAEHLLGQQDTITTSVESIFRAVSVAAEESMGGSSGAMYSLLFAAAAGNLKKDDRTDNPSASEIFEALRKGTDAVSKYGGARRGDRTMLDAILPALDASEVSNTDDLNRLKLATIAAEEGAKATANMKASAGRASYVAQNLSLGKPDPGAHAVGIMMRAVYEAAKAVAKARGMS